MQPIGVGPQIRQAGSFKDNAASYDACRHYVMTAWKRFLSIGSLRFPDATHEERFVLKSGENGLSVMRMHRIVDASIFYLSAKEAAVKYAGSGLGLASLISMTSKWASVIQLLAMASTLLAPKFTAEKHEAFKVNFATMIMVTWVTTNIGTRYQINHAFNIMFGAVNFLPGQVRVAVFGPIVAVQTLIWLLVGARSRALNPEHAGLPLTTLWMWVQHSALTIFMCFALTYCVGTVLEMHARQSYIKANRLDDLNWQPGALPRLMLKVVEQLGSAKGRISGKLAVWRMQQAKVGKTVCSKGIPQQWEELPSSSCAQDSPSGFSRNSTRSRRDSIASSCAASVYSCVSALNALVKPEWPESRSLGCQGSYPAATQVQPAQDATPSRCCMPGVDAGSNTGPRDFALAAAWQEMALESALGMPPAACNSAADGNADVAEAQQVCCGVQGEQAQACQKLLNKGKALDSKCRQLACRVELLEMEVGRDSLAAMAEQARSRQLMQQIAALTQRVNAQRCVATFLGSHEHALSHEVDSLRKERKQLMGELAKAHALIEETAADRLEATELLSRAVHIMESMRGHMSAERRATGQCMTQMTDLQPDAAPAQASASLSRDVFAYRGELARFIQALAQEGAASLSPLESSAPNGGARDEPSRTPQSSAAAESICSTERQPSDPQPSEALHHSSSSGAQDSIRHITGQENSNAQDSFAEHPVLAGLDGELLSSHFTGNSSGPSHDMSVTSQGSGQTNRQPSSHHQPDTGASSAGSMRSSQSSTCHGASAQRQERPEIKHQADSNWDTSIDARVRELYLDVLKRLEAGVSAQKEWLESAESTLSGSPQKPCTACKASSAKLAEAEARYAGLQGALVVILRSMMAREMSLREELARLAGQLSASLSHPADSPCNSCPRAARPSGPSSSVSGAEGLAAGLCCCCGQIDGQCGQAAWAVAQRLQQLSEAPAPYQQAASEMSDMLFPVPSTAELNAVFAQSKSSRTEMHMSELLSMLVAWLRAPQPSETRDAADEAAAVERLRGALEVTVSSLVDRAFAAQTAYVHCAHGLAKQARAAAALSAHLMTVRQRERRMLEMLMANRARLLTHMAVLRTCTRVALCGDCHAPAAPDSLASSPAA